MPTQPITSDSASIPFSQRVIAILWPSFLAGLLATVVFFSLFNPAELALLAGHPDITSLGGYTTGFFFFWFVSAIASWLAIYFSRPCNHTKQQDN